MIVHVSSMHMYVLHMTDALITDLRPTSHALLDEKDLHVQILNIFTNFMTLNDAPLHAVHTSFS